MIIWFKENLFFANALTVLGMCKYIYMYVHLHQLQKSRFFKALCYNGLLELVFLIVQHLHMLKGGKLKLWLDPYLFLS